MILITLNSTKYVVSGLNKQTELMYALFKSLDSYPFSYHKYQNLIEILYNNDQDKTIDLRIFADEIDASIGCIILYFKGYKINTDNPQFTVNHFDISNATKYQIASNIKLTDNVSIINKLDPNNIFGFDYLFIDYTDDHNNDCVTAIADLTSFKIINVDDLINMIMELV